MTSVAHQPEAITAEDAAKRMESSLERGRRMGRSVLLFAVYRAEVTRAHAEALLVAQLEAAGMHVTRVYFPYGGDADWPAQFANSQRPTGEVFFLYNLQQEFPALLDQLNYRRELLTISRVCAVFWVTEAELTQIAEFAPDFFRFRTEVLELLAVPPMDQRSALAEFAFYRDSDTSLAMNPAERQAYIALRGRLLADLGDEESTAGARLDLLRRLGNAYLDFDNYAQALIYHEQALALACEIQDRRNEGNALGNLGRIYVDLGQVRRAINYYEQSLIIAREIGDRKVEGNALGNLGIAHSALRQVRRAIGYYEQALTIAREIRDRRIEGASLGNLGNAYAMLGQTQQAIGYYEQRLIIAREIGDRQGEANTSWSLGKILLQQGNLTKAVTLMQVLVDFEQATNHPNADKDAARVEELRQQLQTQAQAS